MGIKVAMARDSTGSKLTFLPEGTKDFLRRRVVEACGMTVLIFAGIFILALLTYNVADPSFNHATTAAPTNLLGAIGSYTADIMLQVFGLAAWFWPLSLIGWGWRIAAHQPIRHAIPIAAVVLIFVLLPLGAATAALFEPAGGSKFASGYGGWLGQQLLGFEAGMAVKAGIGFTPPLILIFQAPLTLLALFFALAIDLDDWRMLLAGLGRVSENIGQLTAFLRQRTEKPTRSPTAAQRREPAMNEDSGDDDLEPEPTLEVRPKIKRQTARIEPTPQVKRTAAEQQPAFALQSANEYQLPPLNPLSA